MWMAPANMQLLSYCIYSQHKNTVIIHVYGFAMKKGTVYDKLFLFLDD